MTALPPQPNPVSRLNNPPHTYSNQRFADALTNANAQLTAIADRYPFDVGLSHSHLYDGSSRRTMTRGHRGSLLLRCRAPSSPSPCRFIQTHTTNAGRTGHSIYKRPTRAGWLRRTASPCPRRFDDAICSADSSTNTKPPPREIE